MTDCLFCKIVRGDIPAAKVYEDDEMIAFLDIKPTNPGHVLLVPKSHHASLLETPPELLGSMMQMVPSLARAVMKASQTDAFNLLCNTGSTAGQIVFHTHLHIIPRKPDDGYEHWHGQPYADQQEADRMANAIRAALQ